MYVIKLSLGTIVLLVPVYLCTCVPVAQGDDAFTVSVSVCVCVHKHNTLTALYPVACS